MAQPYPVRNPPITTHKSTHGIQIKVNGVTIGSIQDFTHGPIQRAMTTIYELNPLSSGHPIDVVPGNLSGFTLKVSRYDIYTEPFEKVFGGSTDIYEALGMQNRGIEIYRYWFHPNDYKEILVYRNCWLQQVGRTISLGRERTVLADGSFAYVRHDKIA